VDDEMQFSPVRIGPADLDGRVQVLEGLQAGERIVVHSERPVTARSRLQVADYVPPTAP
jgi:multidrug efflux pump subunit AcrA (membrane-fusion protein)